MEKVGRQTHPLRQPEPIAISLVVEWVGGAVARRYAHGPGVDEPLVWYEGAGATTSTGPPATAGSGAGGPDDSDPAQSHTAQSDTGDDEEGRMNRLRQVRRR